jgi:hypothetical protein
LAADGAPHGNKKKGKTGKKEEELEPIHTFNLRAVGCTAGKRKRPIPAAWLNAVDKGLAKLDIVSQLPRPGGVATVLTNRGPEGSGCYSPLNAARVLISLGEVNNEVIATRGVNSLQKETALLKGGIRIVIGGILAI